MLGGVSRREGGCAHIFANSVLTSEPEQTSTTCSIPQQSRHRLGELGFNEARNSIWSGYGQTFHSTNRLFRSPRVSRCSEAIRFPISSGIVSWLGKNDHTIGVISGRRSMCKQSDPLSSH